jgi:BirA family biotin operon repressor/biotin-[acetyl-CoA-carboxylase] ligase
MLTARAWTTEHAAQLAALPLPTVAAVHVADTQTAGAGRRDGRHWWSPPNGNLYVTLIVVLDAAELPALNMAAAVAIALAVGPESAAPVRLKWPNDVLADGRKLAGVLVDAVDIGHASTVVALLGIGVNLRCVPPDASLTLQLPATALAAHAPASSLLDREAFLARLLAELQPLLAAPTAVPRAFARLAFWPVGARVTVHPRRAESLADAFPARVARYLPSGALKVLPEGGDVDDALVLLAQDVSLASVLDEA